MPKERAVAVSVRELVEIIVWLERKLAAGPWDSWDGDLMVEMLELARSRYRACLADLEAQIPPREREEYVIVDGSPA